MRKLSLLILSIVMLFTLAACNSGKLVGRWSATAKVPFDKGELDTSKFTFLEKTTCTYNLTFDESDYTFSVSVPTEQKKTAVAEYKVLYQNYYDLMHKDKGEIKKLMAEANCKTEAELIEKLLLGAAVKEGFTSVDDYICNMLGLDTRVLGAGPYEKDGKIIRLYSGNDETTTLFSATLKRGELTLANGDSPIVFTPDSLD